MKVDLERFLREPEVLVNIDSDKEYLSIASVEPHMQFAYALLCNLASDK